MATVEMLVSGNPEPLNLDLGGRDSAILGRDASCDFVYCEPTVSRRHASIFRQTEGGYAIQDLGSANGVTVNGARIRGAAPLVHNDLFSLGQLILRFVSPETAHLARLVEPLRETDEADEDSTQRAFPASFARGPWAEPSSRGAPYEASPARIHSPWPDAVITLRALLDITQSLGASLSLSEVFPRIVEGLFRVFPQARRGYLLQRDAATGRMELRALSDSGPGSDTVGMIGGQIAEQVMGEGAAFLSPPLSGGRWEDDIAATALSDNEPLRSVMCAPLMGASQRPRGVIHLETNDSWRPFTRTDLEVLTCVAFLAGQAVEYAEMHEELRELDRRNVELELARELQLTFLPQRAPRTAAYQFAHHYRAAQYVAGDYFDYIELPDGRLAIVVGDVAGHGVSAAMVMARLCSEVRYALATTDTPAAAVTKLNERLAEDPSRASLVTQVLCVLDDRRHTLTVVNAGHPFPLLRRSGSKEVRRLDAISGLPLGVDPEQAYSQFSVPLEPGDAALLYTDGLSEVMNPRGELYREARLARAVAAAGPEPKHVIHAALNDARLFSEGRPVHDDLCLVSFARRGDCFNSPGCKAD